MERPTTTCGARGGVDDAAPSYKSSDARAARAATPAEFFAPFIASGWRFIGEAPRALTYASLAIVPPGNEERLIGTLSSYMTPRADWSAVSGKADAARAARACGLLVARDAAEPNSGTQRGRSALNRANLRDHIAAGVRGMLSAMVALRACATVYRHKRWAFECFREMYRKHRELKRRLRNSKKSALGNGAARALDDLMLSFDTMMEHLCDPHGRMRAEFYDGMVICPWDADYEWQKNAAFHEDLFSVPYAQSDDRDMTHSCDAEDASNTVRAELNESSRRSSLSGDSTASTYTDDGGVVGGKRKHDETSASVDITARKCRLKPALGEISCAVALEMAAEIDTVAAAAAHFFATCDLCKDGPTFAEYLTVVTSAYGFSFAKAMRDSVESDVIPHIREQGFPDDVSFHYTMLMERYAAAANSRQLLKLVAEDPNPALHIALLQQVEGAYIMSKDGPTDEVDARFNRLMRQYAIEVAASQHRRMGCEDRGGSETLSPLAPVIRKWMDACKNTLGRLYSPGVPSFDAMKDLREASPNGWVEIGCGINGYWTSVLNKCQIPAQAVNICLNTVSGPILRPFVNIHDDVADVCSEFTKFGILMNCFPHDGDLANECLRNFTGSTVAVIGEWQGTTAGSRFLRRLAKRFELVSSTSLQPSGDSVHEVSIWKRRAERLSRKVRQKNGLSASQTFPAVKKCRVAGCQSTSHTIFCCRLCRSAFACPDHLNSLHDEWDLDHCKVHATRLLPAIDRMRCYDVELKSTDDSKLMRSDTIMAFNPYRAGAETWIVDYVSRANVYEVAKIGIPRVETIGNWR